MYEIELNLQDSDDFQSKEALKSLRTNIEFSGRENKVITFTSCSPNEGKSCVSLSLAGSLSEIGKKVLFIDADLRKSVLVGRHQIKKEMKGLSHFLSGQSDLKEVLCKTNMKNLNLILAGPVPPNPAELLGDKKFKMLIKEARNIYDYVITDTPPLGEVIDGAIVADISDGAVLLIAANMVSYKLARSVKKQLEKAECNILGVVLNKVDMKKNRYYSEYINK